MHRKRVLPLLACMVLLASFPSSYAFQSSSPQALPEPVIENRLQFVEVSVAKQTDKGYWLLLKNLSAKPIIAFSTSVVVNGIKGSGGASVNFSDTPLIAPGKSRMMNVGISDWALEKLREDAPDKAEQPKITVSVAFADLTFDGEMGALVLVLGAMLGEKIQSARIAALLQTVLEGKEQESNKVIESLRQQVSALSEEFDNHDLTGVNKYLPQVSKGSMNDLEIAIRAIQYNTKADMLDSIKKYKAEETSLREWLVKIKNSYEKRVKELSSLL